MVMISAPSACAARVMHDLTALPLNMTVQAPQFPVSQPTWVPVSRAFSLMKCTSSSRASTSCSSSLPLIFNLILCMSCFRCTGRAPLRPILAAIALGSDELSDGAVDLELDDDVLLLGIGRRE